MKILAFICCMIILFMPFLVKAEEFEPLPSESKVVEISPNIEVSSEIESFKTFTQQDIEDLLGPDPYLGPTSWLGTKDDK